MLKSDFLQFIKKICNMTAKMVKSWIVLPVKYDYRSLLQSTCLSWALVIFEVSLEECDIIQFNQLTPFGYRLNHLFINAKKRRQLLIIGLFFHVPIKEASYCITYADFLKYCIEQMSECLLQIEFFKKI